MDGPAPRPRAVLEPLGRAAVSDTWPVPDVELMCRVRDGRLAPNPHRWAPIRSRKLFGEGQCVVFSFPAAFSPTCSTAQLPEVERLHAEFLAAGCRAVFGVAVNDGFAMHAWGESLSIERTHLVPDGNGDFTRRMGMLVRRHALGYGWRSWRYAFVARNGRVAKMFVEPGLEDSPGRGVDPYEVTQPSRVLRWLQENPCGGGVG